MKVQKKFFTKSLENDIMLNHIYQLFKAKNHDNAFLKGINIKFNFCFSNFIIKILSHIKYRALIKYCFFFKDGYRFPY